MMSAPAAAKIMEWLEQREPEMLSLLERIVRINSHTPNKAGVDAVGAVMTEVMHDMDFDVEVHVQGEVGDNLVARNAAARSLAPDARQVLFCGHMDTVFPDDGSFDCFERSEKRVIGPGIVDMKGGLVVGIYALKALAETGLLEQMPVAFIFNSDEETGSYQSRDLVMDEARKSAFAMVFECAGLEGETTTGRKGKTTFKLKALGQAGHAGNLSGPKPTAILELAHKTVALEALNDPARDVSVNVGLVSGGLGPNTIAPSAEAVVECRYRNASDADGLIAAVTAMTTSPDVLGTTLEVEVIPGRPPMEQTAANRKLFDFVRETGTGLDVPVKEDFRGGVSDANYIAHVGCPVIDGMGPIGAGDHSPKEFMVIESLVQRAALTAVALERLWAEYDRGNLFG
ncbi:M20 family metallopeptidase [Desulfovibrio ferrophilus]|uniref:Carboxypeptidase G2 n=1 Tax=Desulfovibrio ferrophilus TaxID=241368 RepID=A0A2Z6AY08_9BACT|nr:M20 family metallopeptidase [Desulfovibrio ferrophilus]BBD08137.1 carboxypeptidase G2 [Desulfovibrio ferrophilus]